VLKCASAAALLIRAVTRGTQLVERKDWRKACEAFSTNLTETWVAV